MIGVCTDSFAQLPPLLVERYGIELVPVTVRVGDAEFLEDPSLDVDGLYQQWMAGTGPAVSTVAPSPGQFALAYERLAERGAREILSVHVGSGPSSTLAPARLAAKHAPVPVRLVDSHTDAIGCCIWAAADAVAAGASVDQAATLAESLAPRVAGAFVVRAPELVTDGDPQGGVPVFGLAEGQVTVLGRAASLGSAVTAMAHEVRAWSARLGRALNVAVGVADRAGSAVGDLLEAALAGCDTVHEVVRCRLGPSVATRSGPGTAGAVFFPA